MLRTTSISIAIWCLATTATIAQLASPPTQLPAPAPPPAITMTDAPMQVHLVRSGLPGCEPHCTEWIAAQGQIDKTTVAQFKKVLAQIGERRPPVLIHSGGGSVEDAIAVGRLIRAKGLDVAVAKTDFAPCAPADTACRKKIAKGGLIGTPKAYLSICASACPLIVAGGTRRYVGSWALLGVHQISTFQKHIKVLRTYQITRRTVWGAPVEVKRTLIAEKRIAEKTVQTQTKSDIYDKVREHFVAMGINDSIMSLLRETPGTSMRWLKRPELLQLQMATDITVNGEQLIAALTTPKPALAAAPAAEAGTPTPGLAVEPIPETPQAAPVVSPVAAVPPSAAADPVAATAAPSVPALPTAPAATAATSPEPSAPAATAPAASPSPPPPRKVEQPRKPANVSAKAAAPSSPAYDFNKSR
jgi:hypothetical protein